jgi:membrane protease YdiL (CAAX protease family)
MNYIQKGYLGEIHWWKYVLTIFAILVGVGLFSLPHSFAIGQIVALGEADLSRIDDLNYLFSLFDANVNIIYMMLPFVGGLIFLFGAVKFLHKQNLTDLTTSRNTIDWARVFFSFFTWGAFVIATVGIMYFIDPENLILNLNWKPFLILCVLGIVLVPIQTSFEEYVFRGYLMQGLGILAQNRWFPLLVTSVLFGMMHYANPEVDKLGKGVLIYYIGTGFLLGIMTLMDEGMELSIGFHAANNLFTALLVTADWTAFQTHSVFKDISEPELLSSILPALMIYPLLLYILSKKYGWTNWKEKLSGDIIPLLNDELNEIS